MVVYVPFEVEDPRKTNFRKTLKNIVGKTVESSMSKIKAEGCLDIAISGMQRAIDLKNRECMESAYQKRKKASDDYKHVVGYDKKTDKADRLIMDYMFR